MTMHALNQIRPKGEPDAPPYAPQRDLANIYLPMLREVFTSLDQANWPPYFQQMFAQDGVTEEQLGQTVTVMVEAHRLFIRDRTVNSPIEAFVAAGINDLPPAARHALFSRIGEVVAGGFFMALRDVTMQGQLSPVHSSMADMIAAGRELSARLSGDLRVYEVTEIERMRASEEETARAMTQSLQQVAAMQHKLTAAAEDKIALQDRLNNATAEATKFAARLSEVLPLVHYFQCLPDAPVWQRVKAAFRVFFRILGREKLP